MEKEKILALDIGEKSVGWAISEYDKNKNNAEILDFGVRIFDNSSYTGIKEQSKLSHKREKRSQRRLIARRKRRLQDLKNLFINEKLVKADNLNKTLENRMDVFLPFKVREKGLSEKIKNIELLIALSHILKRRGYNDKFEIEEEKSKESKKEIKDREKSLQFAELLIEKYKYPILTYWYEGKPREKINIKNIPENLFVQDDHKSNHTGFIYKANKPDKNNAQRFNNKTPILFKREHYKKEVEKILENQNLKDELNKKIIDIIFRQRDFEDGAGPGKIGSAERINWKIKMDEKHLKQSVYGTFHDKISSCRFFKNEDRMSNFSIESDINFILNQSSKIFFNIKYEYQTSENIKNLTKEILNNFLKKLKFDEEEIKKIFEKENIPFPSFVKLSKKDSEKNKEKYDDEKIINFHYKFFLKSITSPYNDKQKMEKMIDINKEKKLTKEEIIEINEKRKNRNNEKEKNNIINFNLNKKFNLLFKKEIEKINLDKLPEKNFDSNLINIIGNIYTNFKTPSRLKSEIDNLEIEFLKKSKKFDFPAINRKGTSKLFTIKALNKQLNEGILLHKYMSDLEKENKDEYLNRQYKNDKIRHFFDKDMITNVSVFRAINQTINLTNKIIKKHGKLKTIIIETANDLNNSKRKKENATSKAIRYAKEKEEIINALEFNGFPTTPTNIFKVKVFKSYSNDKKFFSKNFYELKINDFYDIDLKEEIILFNFLKNNDHQIDHILPLAKTRNNSFENKIITKISKNQEKKDKTPFEYFKHLGCETKIGSWISKLPLSTLSKTRLKYLTWGIDENLEYKDFETYDLNNTRYITKYIGIYFDLEFKRISKNFNKDEINILTVPGQLTSNFRKIWLKNTAWGIKDKERNITPFHHTVDAFVLSNMVTKEHIEFYRTINKLVDIYNDCVNDFSKNLDSVKRTIESILEKFKQDIKKFNKSKILIIEFTNILEEYGKHLTKKISLAKSKKNLSSFSFEKEELNLDFSIIKNLSEKITSLIPIKLKTEWENIYTKINLKEEDIISEKEIENQFHKLLKINGEKINVIQKNVTYMEKTFKKQKLLFSSIGDSNIFYEQKFIQLTDESNNKIIKPLRREIAKFDDLMTIEEYIKKNNREYPYVSYKEDKRTRGKIINGENPINKKILLEKMNKKENKNLTKKEIFKKENLLPDDNGNIWETNKYIGITIYEEKREDGKIIKRMKLVTYKEVQDAHKQKNKIKIIIGKNTIFKAKYNNKYLTNDGLFKFISTSGGGKSIYALHPNLNDVDRDGAKKRYNLKIGPLYTLKLFEFEKVIQF